MQLSSNKNLLTPPTLGLWLGSARVRACVRECGSHSVSEHVGSDVVKVGS